MSRGRNSTGEHCTTGPVLDLAPPQGTDRQDIGRPLQYTIAGRREDRGHHQEIGAGHKVRAFDLSILRALGGLHHHLEEQRTREWFFATILFCLTASDALIPSHGTFE